ncbi:hypothetical protein KXD40_008732 [Peronospora effusa]|uniref:Uncharacterized protein n=1 Tax=Peronospora effusa TaxID=542832 RepID=A0A3M6VNY3_9STRA|nr:hypothetical protein DD238_006339 [Peronospora effusa]RQM18807.1 hypothetical protein DD237_007455 [Peronospora effusa]UIZ22077.1 hypothetical protein KXD40_008732 [Peronospora effusa]
MTAFRLLIEPCIHRLNAHEPLRDFMYYKLTSPSASYPYSSSYQGASNIDLTDERLNKILNEAFDRMLTPTLPTEVR